MSAAAIRLFAAVPVDDRIRTLLEQTAQQVRQSCHFHKWTHASDYHLTLKFLGDTSLERTIKVKEALAAAAARHGTFELSLRDIGVFGASAAPSILWSGISGDTDALKALQKDAEGELLKLGYAVEERPFRPHLTLARKYSGSSPFRKDSLPNMESGLTWTVDRIVLYRSHLGRSPMYEALESFPLIGG